MVKVANACYDPGAMPRHCHQSSCEGRQVDLGDVVVTRLLVVGAYEIQTIRDTLERWQDETEVLQRRDVKLAKRKS